MIKDKITPKEERKLGESIYYLYVKYGPFKVKNYLSFLKRYKLTKEGHNSLTKALRVSKDLYVRYAKGKDTLCVSDKPIATMERDFKYYLASTTLLSDLKRQGLDLKEEKHLLSLYHNFEKSGEKNLGS